MRLVLVSELLSRLHSDEDIEVIVDELKEKPPVVPVVVVVILRLTTRQRGEGENKLEVLLGRRRYPPAVGKWSTPAGKVKFGETPTQAAKREMKEELGVTLERLRGEKIFTSIFPDLGIHTLLVASYTTESVEPVFDPAGEHAEIGWHDVYALPTDLIQDDAEIIKWAVDQVVTQAKLQYLMWFGHIEQREKTDLEYLIAVQR